MMAQSKRISGTVNDHMGPVMMANITEIDANNRIVSAAQTDFNGNFSMEVKSPKNKLRISFVGDKTKTIPVGDKDVFDIMLDADDHTLKEVVVKGSRAGSGGLFIPKREISVAQQTFDMSNVEGMALPLPTRLCRVRLPVLISYQTLVTLVLVLPCVFVV